MLRVWQQVDRELAQDVIHIQVALDALRAKIERA